MIQPAAGQGQWVLSALDKNIDEGTADKSFSSSVSYDIGEIRITKEHKGLPGYEPYVQKSIMTWSPMPTTVAPGEKITVRMTVSDGGSTAEYRNSGILSFSLAGERDYDFIASKYRGMEQTAEYTMPEGITVNELFIKIEGSMGTKDLPSVEYIYTYEYLQDAVFSIPLNDSSGKVVLNTRGVVVPAASATLMKHGDILVTGPDGRVTIPLKEGGEVRLDKNTAVGIIEEGSIALFMGRIYVDSRQGFELFARNNRPDPTDPYLTYRLKTSLDEIPHLIEEHNGSDVYVLQNNGAEFTASLADGAFETSMLKQDSDFEQGEMAKSVRQGETLFATNSVDLRIEPSGNLDEWWKKTSEDNAQNRGSPAFGLGAGAAAVMLAIVLWKKK